jgi:hypothetical protein
VAKKIKVGRSLPNRKSGYWVIPGKFRQQLHDVSCLCNDLDFSSFKVTRWLFPVSQPHTAAIRDRKQTFFLFPFS